MFGGAPTVAALSLLSMGASNVMLSNGELRGAKMAVAFTSANNRRYWQSAFLSSLLWIVAAIAIGFAVGQGWRQSLVSGGFRLRRLYRTFHPLVDLTCNSGMASVAGDLEEKRYQ